MKGTIAREFLPKGYCFVKGDDGQEYFLHANELPEGEWSRERVRKGTRVEFKPQPNGDKFKAVEARLCDAA